MPTTYCRRRPDSLPARSRASRSRPSTPIFSEHRVIHSKGRQSMSRNLIERTSSAYAYPLLIKTLLQSGVRCAPEQEIVFGDRLRYDYRALHRRVGSLADALRRIGIIEGDTVGMLDWDSHRYLECYFAVP